MNKAMENGQADYVPAPVAVATAERMYQPRLDVNIQSGCDFEKANFGNIYGTTDAGGGDEGFPRKAARPNLKAN